MNILGYEAFVDIFLGNHKICLYLGVIFKHFRVFSYGQGTEWGIFFYTKISNIFGGCLKILIFFGVNGGCWAQAYVWRKK